MLPDQLKLTNYKNRINNNKVGMQLVLVHKTLLTLYQFNGLTSSINLIFVFVISSYILSFTSSLAYNKLFGRNQSETKKPT